MLETLKGKKTYIVGVATILYEITKYITKGEFDPANVLYGIGLITMRAGIKNG